VKNVVIINDHAFVNGGQAKVAIETALALRAGGLSVHFFAGVGPVDSRLEEAAIHCICLKQFDILSDPARIRAAVQGIWNREASTRLRALLSQMSPHDTIIHVHGWAKSLSPSIGPAVTAGPIPHVYTLHEYFLACPNGGFFDYQAQALCTRRPLGAACMFANCDARSRSHKAWRVGRQTVLWTAGRMPRKLRDVIFLTQTQLRAIQPYLSPRARLHHLPNAVRPTPGERIRAEENNLYLFIGRLSPEKGAEVAARAAARAGVEIAFAGDGECKDSIIRDNPDARMLGWLKIEDLAAWVERARCLVFPSLWYEGYPMSVVEAMQRGIPVLVSDCTSAIELVRHDVDGLHVRAGDVGGWASAIQLLNDRERLQRYSRSSFDRAKSFLDVEGYRTRLLSIYAKAASAQFRERSCGHRTELSV
jgi:glycosyltransferase involved in cell wall biosynthesis